MLYDQQAIWLFVGHKWTLYRHIVGVDNLISPLRKIGNSIPVIPDTFRMTDFLLMPSGKRTVSEIPLVDQAVNLRV